MSLEGQIKPILMWLPLAMLFGTSPFRLKAAEQAHLPALIPLARECLYFAQLEPCRGALRRAENLQLSAESQENYSCQTRALGLGADLIMSQLKKGRGDSALMMLEEVIESCQGL